MKNIFKIFIYKFLRKKGYQDYMISILIKEVYNDFFKNKQTTLKEKIWSYKMGFISSKIKNYGLTDSNYKDFLNDFDYYRLYPLNSPNWSKLIDDKLTTKYVLGKYMPEYYFNIDAKGKIIAMQDYYKKDVNVEDVIDLIKEKKILAFKLSGGSLGVGFYKVSFNGDFYINSKKISEQEIINFIKNLKNYLITEFIIVHDDIKKYYSKSANTLRVMVINEEGNNPKIANSFMRFGTSKTGSVDNASAGGIFTIVDVQNGRYFDAKRVQNNELISCPIHPDSKLVIEGFLPHWDMIKEKLIDISLYLPGLKYAGFDIAITNKGFKIIEINSHQDVKWYQYYYPILKDNEASEFFINLLRKK